MAYDALGEFEQSLLLAIAHLGDGAYGVTIRQEIETRTGREIAVGALYTSLARLERKGYVRSWHVMPAGTRSAPAPAATTTAWQRTPRSAPSAARTETTPPLGP